MPALRLCFPVRHFKFHPPFKTRPDGRCGLSCGRAEVENRDGESAPMNTRRPHAAALLCALLLFANIPARARQTSTPDSSSQRSAAQTPAARPTPDPNDPVQRIRDEALNRSQVMQILGHLTDVIGPRLTGSPGMKRANEWTRDKTRRVGLAEREARTVGAVRPRLGAPNSSRPRSSSRSRSRSSPTRRPGRPRPAGRSRREVVYVDAKDEQGLQKFKGQLRGKIVLNGAVRDIDGALRARGHAPDREAVARPRQRARPRDAARRARAQTPEQRAASPLRLAEAQLLSGRGRGARRRPEPRRRRQHLRPAAPRCRSRSRPTRPRSRRFSTAPRAPRARCARGTRTRPSSRRRSCSPSSTTTASRACSQAGERVRADRQPRRAVPRLRTRRPTTPSPRFPAPT